MLRARVGDLLALSKLQVLDKESWITLLACIRNFANNLHLSKEKKLYCSRVSDAISAHLLGSNVAPLISNIQQHASSPSALETKLIEQLVSHTVILANESNLDCKLLIPKDVALNVHKTWHRIPARSDYSFAGVLIHLAFLCSQHDSESQRIEEHVSIDSDNSQRDESMTVELSKEELLERLQEFLRNDENCSVRTALKQLVFPPQKSSSTQYEAVNLGSHATSEDNTTYEKFPEEDILYAWTLVSIRRWLISTVAGFRAYSQPNVYLELQGAPYNLQELIELFREESQAVLKIVDPLRALTVLVARYGVIALWAEKLRSFPIETHYENTVRILEQVEEASQILQEDAHGSTVVGANIFRALPDTQMKNVSTEFSAIALSFAALISDLLDTEEINADVSQILTKVIELPSVAKNARLTDIIKELVSHLQKEDEISRFAIVHLQETINSLLNKDNQTLQWDNELSSAQQSPIAVTEEHSSEAIETKYLLQQIEDAKETHFNLISEKADLVLELSREQEKCAELKRLNEELTGTLAKHKVHEESLAQKIAENNAALSAQRRELQEARENSTKLSILVTDANTARARLERELDQRNTQLENERLKLQQQRATGGDVMSDSSLRGSGTKSSPKVEKQEVEYRQRISELEKHVAALQELLDANEKAVEEENKKTKMKTDQLIALLNERDSQVKSLEENIKEQASRISDNEEERRLLDEHASSQANSDRSEIKDLRAQLARVQKKLSASARKANKNETPLIKRGHRQVCKHCDVMRRLYRAFFSKRPTPPATGEKRQRGDDLQSEGDESDLPWPKRQILGIECDESPMCDVSDSPTSSPSVSEVILGSADLAKQIASSQFTAEDLAQILLLAQDVSSLNHEQLLELSATTNDLESFCRRISNTPERERVPLPQAFNERVTMLWGPPLKLIFDVEKVSPNELTQFFSEMKSKISEREEMLNQLSSPPTTAN